MELFDPCGFEHFNSLASGHGATFRLAPPNALLEPGKATWGPEPGGDQPPSEITRLTSEGSTGRDHGDLRELATLQIS